MVVPTSAHSAQDATFPVLGLSGAGNVISDRRLVFFVHSAKKGRVGAFQPL